MGTPSEIDSASGGAGRAVLALAWPVLVQQLLIFGVGLSDRWLVGQYKPSDGSEIVPYQAAHTTMHYLSWVLSSYSVLVTAGATALIGRAVGAGDRVHANSVLHQALLLALGYGLTGAVLGIACRPVLVQLLQLSGPASGHATAYLLPMFLFLPCQILELTCIACLVGAGDTKPGLWVLGGVALLNLPFAYFFREWLGYPGVAWGTGLTHTVGCAFVLGLLLRGRGGLKLQATLFRPCWETWQRLCRVGVPAGVDSLSIVLGQLWFLSLVNQLGEDASAAHGIALQWESLAYLPGASFGTAATSLVARSLGARSPGAARRFGWTAFCLACVLMSALGMCFYLCAPQMFALLCPSDQQASVIIVGVPVLRLVAFAMPALASTIVFTSSLRGAGDTRVPVLFTWVGFLLVRIPLTYYLTTPAMGLGLLGAWLAMFADLWVRGLFFMLRFASGRWALHKV